MANTFRKIYKRTGNNGNDSDYELIANVGVNGVDLDIMKGATSSAAGEIGLVPKPAAGASNRYLRCDGTWAVPPDTNTTYNLSSFGITASAAELNRVDGVTSNIQTQINTTNNKITTLQNTVNGLRYTKIVSLVTSEHGSTFSFTNSRTAGYAFYLLLIRLGSNYDFRIIGHNGNYLLSATDSTSNYYTTHYQVNINIKNSGTRYTVTLSGACGSRTGSYFTGTFIYVSKIYGIII